MDQELRQRLVRIERRATGAVLYSSVALGVAILMPLGPQLADAFGIQASYGYLAVLAVGGVLGLLFGRQYLRYADKPE